MKRTQALLLVLLVQALALATSCGTLPKGNLTLSKELKFEQNLNDEISYLKGRPIYIKAYAYPFIDKSGHIYDGRFVHFFMGREKLTIQDLSEKKGKNHYVKHK